MLSNLLSKAAVLVIVVMLNLSPCHSEDLPSRDRVSQLAKQLHTLLYKSFMESSAYTTLKDSCADHLSSVRFDAVNTEDELAEMAAKITGVFTKRTIALHEIVKLAEDTTMTYSYDPHLKKGDVPLFKMAEYNETSAELNYSPHFHREISEAQSGVHTPLEVYEGYADVLNGLRWSADVDEAFKKNLVNDPDISWQYLGTQLGFLRVFPATWWQPPEHLRVDLYDVRRRPWYIEAAVSPKDVIIVMDISGSVHGQTFEIMKIAVKTVLNTLGENDYVNVAWSTNRVGWADPCMTTLMPATMVNKRALFAAVDSLHARNTSSWARGLEFAYRAFIDFYGSNETDRPEEHAGADCHKLIMFFTDGGTEWPGDVIKKYKKDNITKDVRLFTYALGPHPVPPHTLKAMACKTGGTMSVIVASGAIRTGIQESYLGVLAKPLVLSDAHPVSGSSAYLDAGGLGYVTTLAMPVFNKSQQSDGQTLVGVAGVDITMKELHAFSPDHKLGPFGYTFAINPNGIVMFHPRLKEPLHYMEDPPDLDLTVLEGNKTEIHDLRIQMIRRKAYSLSMDQTLVLPDGHSVEVRDLNVSYRPVDNTTLSVGLVTPAGQTYLVVSGQSPSGGLPDCSACLVAPSWNYCPGLTSNGTERWQQLSDLLKEDASACDGALVRHLLWDSGWTGNVVPVWSDSQPEGVTARFVVTASALTRLYPISSASELASEGDPHRSSLYKHAALSDDLVLRTRAEPGHVLAARRIASVKSTGSTYTLAVAGVQYNATHIDRLVNGVLGSECSPQLGVHCWLLDTAADIVYSSQQDVGEGDVLGEHLGQSDPQLMRMLTNMSVYQQRVEFDYQGVCVRKPKNEGAGSRPWSFLSMQFLVDGVIGLLQWLDYLRYLIVSLLVAAQPAPSVALDEFGFEIHAFEHSCTQRLVRTRLTQTTSQPAQGSLTCPDTGCTRKFRASRLTTTNLLLVVSDLPCACPELDTPPLPYTPEDGTSVLVTCRRLPHRRAGGRVYPCCLHSSSPQNIRKSIPRDHPAGQLVLPRSGHADAVPDQCMESQKPLFRRRPATCFAQHEGVTPPCARAPVFLPEMQSLLLLLSSAILAALPCHLVAA